MCLPLFRLSAFRVWGMENARVDLFWEDVPGVVGKRIERVRFTTLATTVGESLVVIACDDGTLVRLRCTDLGCEIAEIVPGQPE